MNWTQIEGDWKQLAGQVKSKWGKLTDDDVTYVSGKREQLVGKVEARYGVLKEEAERQVDEWAGRILESTQKSGKATDRAPHPKT